MKVGIRAHMEVHSGTKKYQCEYCDKQFRFKVGWEGHMNAHRGIYPYECIPCEKVGLICKFLTDGGRLRMLFSSTFSVDFEWVLVFIES